MMQKCGNCIWHDDNAVCKNPDALMMGCVIGDLSWCEKYKKKVEGCTDRKMEKEGRNMSECVVRMPYPKDCESCHLKTRNFFTGDFICAKTHTFLPSTGKNNNCPIIRSLPEGHGRLSDLDELEQKINRARIRAMQDRRDTNPYWECGDIIASEKTIVPAERSEA